MKNLKKNKLVTIKKKNIRKIKLDLPVSSKNFPSFLKELRKIMWNYFGIVRKKEKMKMGFKKLSKLNPKDIRSKNIKTTALAIAKASIKRQKSLGCHWVE